MNNHHPLILPAQSSEDALDRMAHAPFLARLLDQHTPGFAEPDISLDPNAPDLGPQMRALRKQVALWTAFADISGHWTLDAVMQNLTRFAQSTTQAALHHCMIREHARGKLSEMVLQPELGGLFAVAMGKMGAAELNYSSDIDLVLIFDEAQHDGADLGEVRHGFLRAARAAMALLSDVTAEGYVFRTDLRLRPNPAVTPIVISTGAAENYYAAEGRTWERAAYIKACAAAGDVAAGAAFLDRLVPFVWRRHLDFAAIEDAHNMRRKIRDHKGFGGKIEVPGHDLKLGRGGIREIEFFAQTQQLIFGGRDPDLRQRDTQGALQALARKGHVTQDVADTLIACYRDFRFLEHRIQMLRDAQTQTIPANADEFENLARLSGWQDTRSFEHEILSRLQQTDVLIEAFYASETDSVAPVPLAELHPDMTAVMDRWPVLPVLRSDRAMRTFERVQSYLVARIQTYADPNRVVRRLDDFLRGLPAGAQLFALFEAKPQVMDLLLDICAAAPGMASYLAQNRQVFDAMLTPEFAKELPEALELETQLTVLLDATDDYETALIVARRWLHETQFRVSVQLLRLDITPEEAARAYSDLAQAVLGALLPVVEHDIARRYGCFDDQAVAVLAMGKLGARAMSPTSDLDLIVIYNATGDASDGARSLAPQVYFARLTKALITALSAPMQDGTMYEVDMRLRPSGRKGPVATSLTSFDNYQRTEAWTWEHLALTRARVVAGDRTLAGQIETLRGAILTSPRKASKVLGDVADMRARLAADKAGQAGDWDIKDRAGGLLDIEIFVQGLSLINCGNDRVPRDQIAQAVNEKQLTLAEANVLASTHSLLSQVQCGLRLLGLKTADPETLGQSGSAFLTAICHAASLSDLRQTILDRTQAVDQLISRKLETHAQRTSFDGG